MLIDPLAGVDGRWRASLAAITPLVQERAPEAEQLGRLTPDVVAALIDGRWFRLWIPRAYDGEELALPASLRLFEALSRVDGSAGWAFTIGVGGGLFAAQMDPQGAHEIYGPREAVIAGSGHASGTAAVADGGYRAGGRWSYASGAPHASWFTANCVVERDGEPVRTGDGQPLIRAMAFPASAVEWFETWQVTGMRATASVDFAVAETFVPARHSFSVFSPPVVDGPLYRFPFSSIAEASFAAVALGVARGALDAFADLARAKRSWRAEGSLAEQPTTRLRYAEAEASLAAARAAFVALTSAGWEAVAGGAALGTRAEAELRLASVHASQSATRAVDLLHGIAGMSPLFTASAFGRAWRDVHTVSQHALLNPAGAETAAAELLAAP